MIEIYEFLDRRGCGVVSEWPLEIRDRARLEEKLGRLRQADFDLLTGLIAGAGVAKIFKLQVNGAVALRPMLCRGPFNMRGEVTLLVPATERDRKLVPGDAPRMAVERRQELLDDRTRRRLYD